jgi:hypothetical protein
MAERYVDSAQFQKRFGLFLVRGVLLALCDLLAVI